MNRISAIIITLNEEKNIEDCLKSLAWTDEIILIDSGSSDKTVEISKKYTESIILSDNIAFGLKRNMGIENASGDWILWLDADERVTEPLAEEIRLEIRNPAHLAYYINRKSFFISRFINHCGWFPDHTLRFFKKSTGLRFNQEQVHEKLTFNGKTGKLKNLLLHYTDRDFEHYTEKLNSYTTLSVIDLNKRNKKSGLLDVIFRPVFAFFKMYFFRLGFLDGYMGLVLCILSSYHVFFKHAKSMAGSD